MRMRTFLHIAHEGWLIVIGLLLVAWAAVSADLALLAGAAGLLTAVSIGFFYDSDRALCTSPLGVVAPVDGRVVSVDSVTDPFLDRPALRVRVRPSLLGAYFLRAAIEGKLRELRASDGSRCSGASWIQSDEGDDVVMAASDGGLLGQRPCMLSVGERVGQGRRCGLRRLARYIDVYVAANSRIKVQPGQRVRAGTDMLGTIARKSSEETVAA